MGAICGILGKCDTAVVAAMARALGHRGDLVFRDQGDAFAVASSCPIVSNCLIDGRPQDADNGALPPSRLQAWCASASREALAAPRGAFAAVVGAENAVRWWLMRDRLGRQPLYYYVSDSFLLFASELIALLATGHVARRLNLSSVDRYLMLRCVPGPETIIQGVRKVRPGHIVEYAGSRLSESRFSGFTIETNKVRREIAASAIRDRLSNALAQCSPGVLLWSSGIDCAALASLRTGLQPVFVGLERAWQDEARLARESARRLHLVLDTIPARRLTEDGFAKVVRRLDEPVADASVFPLWLILDRVAQRGHTVITAHGADEILGGFPRYHFLQKAQNARVMVPASHVTGLLPSLPPNAFVRRGSRYLAAIGDRTQAYLSLLSVFDYGERQDLYTDAMKSALYDREDSVAVVREHFTDADLTRNVLSLDLNIGLPDLLLFSCDRVAAAHGLNLEYPYLDDSLVDYVITLSPGTKFGVRSKPLLRLAMKGILPPRVRLRARRGFRIPQSGRLMRVIENVTGDMITPERVDATGLFRWPYVEDIVRSAGHNVYRRRQFWALLMFFAWYKEVMES